MTEPAQTGSTTFSAAEAIDWTKGWWRGAHPAALAGVSTDTRQMTPGALYVAIKGPTFDGHAFARQAIDRGAAAVMMDSGAVVPEGIPALVVPGTAAALTALAAGWRAAVDPTVVGITGSAGKTTVKELTSHLLGALGPTAKTLGNWNNSLGLPKSLLAMPRDSRFGVFEAGTNHPGEIAPLAALMRPDCAVVTNVGPVHIEFFGSEEAIADEKADLLRAVPADGFVVLDADSPHFRFLSAQPKCRVVAVSLRSGADYRAVEVDPVEGFFKVEERGSGETQPVFTGRPGVHQVVNALQAIAVARQFGVPWPAIVSRLADAPGAPMRWEVVPRDGIVWINDAYNANPISMAKSLETFAAMDAKGGRKVAVLGDMFELGDRAEAMHRAVGTQVAASGVDVLVAVGAMSAQWMADAALKAGLAADRVLLAADAAAARDLLKRLLKPGDHALLKASHGMALESILG
jgi:UDP-N-acetylmuramoyl-tripeptide--D-alanyl-D-alanine ligase